ncbi:AAA family ATPase [Amycolatopsis sp. NPDC058986]|uniref:P-loop NTPase n=1 Tax=unclassified Amycolatopsis TaxID=2618356 RepID=UPI0036704AA5
MSEVVRQLPVRRGRRSLADRVRPFFRTGFIGRDEYRQVFGSALRGGPDAPQVLFVHGPGGIGKSALLRQLADDADERGRTVVWVDGEYVLTSTSALTEAVAPVHTTERPVLVIDGFEHCQALEAWLREQLLPTVPEDTVVVIAGRRRPEPQWTLDLGWRHLVRTIPLAPLTQDEVSDLLTQRGVPGELHATVNGFAAGHPLTLCLAAEETTVKPGAVRDAEWEPSPQVIETLLARMIDRVPSAAHEYGLRVCGHVRHVTVGLLRTGLNEHDAHTVFDWLAGLPYVETGRHGLVCHELVREVLDSSFKWRDPVAYGELNLRLWRYLLNDRSPASDDEIDVAAGDLLYLSRYLSPAGAEILAFREREALFESAYLPEMREDLLRLAREYWGEEHTRLVAYWLDRQPEGFSVYHRAEDMTMVSFYAWLRLSPGTDELSGDPVLAPVREYLDQAGQVKPGEHVGVARFGVPALSAENYVAEVTVHTGYQSIKSLHRKDGLVASFLLVPNATAAVSQLEPYDLGLYRAIPELGDGSWGLFIRDWREIPLGQHLERTEEKLRGGVMLGDAVRETRAAPAMSQEEFFAAVKQALRDWHDDEALAVNQLIRVYGDLGALRAAVVTTVDALRQDPRRLRQQRAVQATYLDRDTNQRAAAARLGVPFSSYRRHLQSGEREICDALWQHHHRNDEASSPGTHTEQR